MSEKLDSVMRRNKSMTYLKSTQSNFFSSSGFSTSMRWKSVNYERQPDPGPGSYELRTSFGNGKAWLKGRKAKFGTEVRPCLRKKKS